MTASLFDDVPLQVPPMALQLRPYQQEAVDSIFAWFEKETGNPLVVLPTGAGKSLVLAAFIHAVLSAYPRERILVLTHVKELIAQNHAQLLRCWPGAPAGICSAGLRRREHDAPILFAGIQSTYRHAAKIGWTDLVLVDEAHLIPKEGFGMYRKLLQDLSSMNSKLKVIGLTATPFRTGEGSLDAGADRLFHGIAYTASLVELIRDGYLSPVTSKSTAAEVSTAGVHRVGGEFVAKELEDAALQGDLVQRAVAEIVNRGRDRKAWLIFCCGVRHAEAVYREIEGAGIPVACIFGDTLQDERDAAIEAFKRGELRCIVNVNVLTTGFDAPHVDLIALLRPTCSPGLYVQMVGRGLRRAPGKTDALILDFGSNAVRHGPIDAIAITQPKDKGSTTNESVERVLAKSCPKCQTLVAVAVRQCPDCGHMWPEPTPDHAAKPDEEAKLVQGTHPTGGIERWNVQRTFYRLHRSKDPKKPPTLCVEYRCGFHQTAREWICLEHIGYARTKAAMWWKHHGGQMPAPETVDVALTRIECGELLDVAVVTVDVRGEYPEVKGTRMAAREAGEHDFGAAPKAADSAASDIPF